MEGRYRSVFIMLDYAGTVVVLCTYSMYWYLWFYNVYQWMTSFCRAALRWVSLVLAEWTSQVTQPDPTTFNKSDFFQYFYIYEKSCKRIVINNSNNFSTARFRIFFGAGATRLILCSVFKCCTINSTI
jgi:hypothetical protein